MPTEDSRRFNFWYPLQTFVLLFISHEQGPQIFFELSHDYWYNDE